ncbi:MAG: chemotaxis-specific protein-glutamate methyltransferase CheB [Clostridiales bacterium]
MKKLKVLLADDSIVYRKIITKAVELTNLAVVDDVATNGNLAIEKLKTSAYDVVLLDVNMPELDGIETLKIIKKNWNKTPVIMISGFGGKDAYITIKALELGALDFIVKPLEENYDKNMEIVMNYLKVLFNQIHMEKSRTNKFSDKNHINKNNFKNNFKNKVNKFDLVVIASSTGGPIALENLLKGLSEDFNKKVLIVQHMPPDFTRVLAESLDKISAIKVVEGNDFDKVRSGLAIIAPGGHHMTIDKKGSQFNIRINSDKYINGVRPSADVLFKSIAKKYKGSNILSIILTGMGSDGLDGIRELKENCNCYCITQSERTCVVYGMPRCIEEEGLSDESIDLDKIADRIQQIIRFGS